MSAVSGGPLDPKQPDLTTVDGHKVKLKLPGRGTHDGRLALGTPPRTPRDAKCAVTYLNENDAGPGCCAYARRLGVFAKGASAEERLAFLGGTSRSRQPALRLIYDFAAKPSAALSVGPTPRSCCVAVA
jgi:hypothetical protein